MGRLARLEQALKRVSRPARERAEDASHVFSELSKRLESSEYGAVLYYYRQCRMFAQGCGQDVAL